MAGYSIRPLAELGREARAFFTQSIPGAVASVWANSFVVIGKVLALLNFEHELRRRWLYQQMFASTAAREWLIRHGFEVGLTIDPPARAMGTITLAAAQYTVVPSGLQFTRADGVTYTTIAGATATTNSVSLPVQADAAGLIGNCEAGEDLSLVDEPIEGLDTLASVDPGGLAGGADEEDLEVFRARVLARRRRAAQGGSSPDYETWAREALAQVDRVWVDSFANDQRSVWVAFTVTDRPNGIPTEGQRALVQAYISDPVRRPVTARAYAVVPTPLAVPVLIQGLTPDTIDIRTSVETELAATFADRAEPGRPDGSGLFSRSWLDEAIARATGEERHVIVAPAADIPVEPGQMPVLGAVTYTD
ncbi:baseplate J/gp47 family protein [Methylobacterium sp. A54F]